MKPPLPIAFAPTALAQERLAQARLTQERLARTRPGEPKHGALTGCPWHDVKAKLRGVGLRPTRQRMALGWILFAKGDRHVTAEMLYEEANRAKVPVSLATVYNTLHQFTEVACCGRWRSTDQGRISTPTIRCTTTFSSRIRTSFSISRPATWWWAT